MKNSKETQYAHPPPRCVISDSLFIEAKGEASERPLPWKIDRFQIIAKTATTHTYFYANTYLHQNKNTTTTRTYPNTLAIGKKHECNSLRISKQYFIKANVQQE